MRQSGTANEDGPGIPGRLAQRAVDVLGTAAHTAGASVALRRAYAAALTQLGFAQQRAQRNEAAQVTLQAALEAWRGIDGLSDDGDAAANFAITSAWLMDALADAGRPTDALRVGDEARAVATRLLERQPTHMLALRARALLATNASISYGDLLQAGEQVRAADAAAEDWLQLSRIDPTNVITIHNLGVARIIASRGLWDLGRPREATAKLTQSWAVQEALADRSTMVQNSLSVLLQEAARIHAELGQGVLADRQFAETLKYWADARTSFAPNSFEDRVYALSPPVLTVEQAVARGDLAAARASAKGVREGLLQVDPGDDPQHRFLRANYLRRLHAAMARVEIESNDWAAAETQLRRVAEARRDLPLGSVESRRQNANELALQALVLARLGRVDEARPLAAQALAFERELHVIATDDQMHKLDLAIALVASAWVDGSRASYLLVEAQAAFDSMPAEARALRTSRWVEGLIADARSGAR